MKYFKTEATRTAPRHRIDDQEFEKWTGNEYPYEKKNEGGKTRHYAICPSCLNPIQIIGLYNQLRHRLYGKHAGKDIEDLGKWNQVKYEYCPYAKPAKKRSIDPDERVSVTEDIIDLYDFLKENFDLAVAIISQDFGIRCSYTFWERALKSFCVSEGYCYPRLTEANLPYIFAFFGIAHYKIFGQQVAVGSDLYNELSKHKEIYFEETQDKKYVKISNQKGQFVNLYFRLTGHTQSVTSDDTLKESILFCVDDRTHKKAIFEKRITFDETRFTDFMRQSIDNGKRDKTLLDIAERIMTQLQPPLQEDQKIGENL